MNAKSKSSKIIQHTINYVYFAIAASSGGAAALRISSGPSCPACRRTLPCGASANAHGGAVRKADVDEGRVKGSYPAGGSLQAILEALPSQELHRRQAAMAAVAAAPTAAAAAAAAAAAGSSARRRHPEKNQDLYENLENIKIAKKIEKIH